MKSIGCTKLDALPTLLIVATLLGLSTSLVVYTMLPIMDMMS
jgi:hypothetical protein